SLDCCFVVLPSDDEPQDSVRCEFVKEDYYKLIDEGIDLRILEIFKDNFAVSQALIVNDVANDRKVDPFRKAALSKFQIYSLFYIPVTYEQKLVGLLGGYKCEQPAGWSMDKPGGWT